MKLSGAVFLVTGGSSGLGAATTRRFYAAGARLLICNRNATKGNALASELGERARFVQTDVTSEGDVLRALEVARQEFGQLNGLVNCAGVGMLEPILGKEGSHRLETFLYCLQANVVGTFNCVRLAAAVMARNAPNEGGERGVIVNTASIVAYDGQTGVAAYAASNAAIIGMTLPIALDLADCGVRVVTIAPGPFLTPRLQSMRSEQLESLAEAIPFPRRLGRPDEYAALVQHVVENEMLNGETIRLDGAMRLQRI